MAPENSALYQHLLLIKSRPAIFLGGHSIDRLNANLYGWKAHRHSFPDGDVWADSFFADFHGFVAAFYNERRKLDWHAIIAGQTAEPRGQLALFYDLLESFNDSVE